MGRAMVAVTGTVDRVRSVMARVLGGRRRSVHSGGSRLSERDALVDMIARLDIELDRVLYQVARGGGSPDPNDNRRVETGLAGLLSRVHDLKQRLCRARARLSRLDRDASRELRLMRTLLSKSPLQSRKKPDGQTTGVAGERCEFDKEDYGLEYESLLD